VLGVIKGCPSDISARFVQPLVGELGNALQVIMVAAENQQRRLRLPDALHRDLFVGETPREFDVVEVSLARRVMSRCQHVDCQILERCRLARNAGADINDRRTLENDFTRVTAADSADACRIRVRQRFHVFDN